MSIFITFAITFILVYAFLELIYSLFFRIEEKIKKLIGREEIKETSFDKMYLELTILEKYLINLKDDNFINFDDELDNSILNLYKTNPNPYTFSRVEIFRNNTIFNFVFTEELISKVQKRVDKQLRKQKLENLKNKVNENEL